MLTMIEEELGIVKNNVESSELSRSVELYAQALILFNKPDRLRNDLLTAQDMLNESITLNPDNIDSIQLIDKVYVELGGNIVITLPSGLRSLYDRAENEYQKGNIEKSYDIISSVANDETMRMYNKYNKLKELVYKDYFDSLKGLWMYN